MLQSAIRNRLVDADRAIKSLRFDITNSIAYRNLPSELRQFVHGQLFDTPKINDRTPSSMLSARRASAAALQSTARMFFNDLFAEAPDPFLATFAYRDGEVPIGHRLRNAQTMISDTRAALLAHKMDGILTPDIDLLLLRGKRHPIVAFHLHGLVFSTGSTKRKTRLKHTARRLNAHIGLQSRMGCGSHLTGKRKGDFRIHAEKMATYAGKIVAALKVETRKRGRPHLSRERAFFTPHHAFNLLYAWSQIPVWETVIPVDAGGREMHQGWLRRIKRSRIQNSFSDYLGSDSSDELWQRVLSSVNSGNAAGLDLQAI